MQLMVIDVTLVLIERRKTSRQYTVYSPGIFNWHSKHNTKYSVLQNTSMWPTEWNTNEKVQKHTIW